MFEVNRPGDGPVPPYSVPLSGDVSTHQLEELLDNLSFLLAQFLFAPRLLHERLHLPHHLLPLLSAWPREVPLEHLLQGRIVNIRWDVGISQLGETVRLVVDKS